MKPIIQRAAIITILSSILFIISNVYSVGSLIVSKSVLPSLALRLSLVALLYCLFLGINIYTGIQLLKILKKEKK